MIGDSLCFLALPVCDEPGKPVTLGGSMVLTSGGERFLVQVAAVIDCSEVA
jgi:hypothetical protein